MADGQDFAAQLRAALGREEHEDKPAATDTYGELARLITQVAGVEEPAHEDRLEDVGITSLNLIELTVRAEERFTVRFDEGTAAAFETVGEVADYIDTRTEKQ